MLTRQPFWFLRHGETDWNRAGRCQGRTDVPLSTKGEAQAHSAVPHLRHLGINAICSSPLKRARHTADIVGQELGVPVIDVQGLEEMDVGPYEALRTIPGSTPGGKTSPSPASSLFPQCARAWRKRPTGRSASQATF